MTHFAAISFFLCIMILVACRSEPSPQPEHNQDFRSSFAGTYLLHRLTQHGTIGQDTITLFDSVEETEVTYNPGDSMLVSPGYEKLPVVAFGDRLTVALRESEDGSFVEIQHSTIPGNQVNGGFLAPDSVYLFTHYVHGGTEFISEVLAGRKVK